MVSIRQHKTPPPPMEAPAEKGVNKCVAKAKIAE